MSFLASIQNGGVALKKVEGAKDRSAVNLDLAGPDVLADEAERWKYWASNSITNREAFNIFALASKCKFVLSKPTMSVTELMEEPEVYRNRSLQYLWNQYTTDEQKTLGSTHWAVYNAMTHWSTHAPAAKKTAEGSILAIKGKRVESVREAAKSLAA